MKLSYGIINKEYLLKRTPWSKSISIWRRLLCSIYLLAFYSWAPPHLSGLFPLVILVTTMFWVPENRLVLLLRTVSFWVLALMLIHAIPASPELYVYTFPLNSVLEPVMGFIGLLIGLARYADFTQRIRLPSIMRSNQMMTACIFFI